jgi:predicted nucleic acid-binding protein
MIDYLDASALVPFLLPEAASECIDAFIARAENPLAVSEFAAAEVASALSRLVRTHHLAPSVAAERLSDLDTWRVAATEDVDLQASDVRLASLYVRRFDLMLRAPDALHAAICMRANFRLITFDKRLAIAAQAIGVAVELLLAA